MSLQEYPYDTLLHRAAVVAKLAHLNQGYGVKDYYEHHVLGVVNVLNVSMRAPTARHLIVAMLHDVIEDTVITPFDLEALGFPHSIIQDVVTITRSENETYAEYIDRIAKDNGVALRVKIADLRFNLKESYDLRDSKKDAAIIKVIQKRIDRYAKAERKLNAIAKGEFE